MLNSNTELTAVSVNIEEARVLRDYVASTGSHVVAEKEIIDVRRDSE